MGDGQREVTVAPVLGVFSAGGAERRTAPDETLRVALVDDDESIRFLIRTLVEDEGIGIDVYGSAEAFLAAWDSDSIGCLVLDLHLPGLSGLELQDALVRAGHALPIIFFTAQGTIPKAVTALKAGAVDFVEKPFDNRDLLRRIRQSLDAESSRRQENGCRGSAPVRLAQLSPREREVMQRVVSGRLNKNIAQELGVCVKTVEYHRARIMQKLGVRSVAELVQLNFAERIAGAATAGPGRLAD